MKCIVCPHNGSTTASVYVFNGDMDGDMDITKLREEHTAYVKETYGNNRMWLPFEEWLVTNKKFEMVSNDAVVDDFGSFVMWHTE